MKVFSSRNRSSFDWRRQRHLADLVEEQRAAVGRFEQAALLLAGVGEGAALVAEQLALEQLLGQRRAGDVDERTVRAVAVEVNGLGGEVLAGSGFAGEQHGGGAAGGDAREQRLHLLHRRRRADDGVEAGFLPLAAAQRADFAPQLAGFERLLDEHRHFVEIERLVDVVVRPELHRLDGVLDSRKRGHQDDQRLGRGAP